MLITPYFRSIWLCFSMNYGRVKKGEYVGMFCVYLSTFLH